MLCLCYVYFKISLHKKNLPWLYCTVHFTLLLFFPGPIYLVIRLYILLRANFN